MSSTLQPMRPMWPQSTTTQRASVRRGFVCQVALLGLALTGLLGTGGCSHVTNLYQAPPYMAPASEPKRLQIVGWGPAGQPGLAPLLQLVASDYLKLRKNYLIAAPTSPPRALSSAHVEHACSAATEAVLLVRALDVAVAGKLPAKTTLTLSAELIGCADGALLFRSEGRRTLASDDKSLLQLANHYVAEVGEPSRPFVACAFSLLQELLSPMENPQLTDTELEEKIELDAG